MRLRTYFICIFAIVLGACSRSEEKSRFENQLDLMEYGVPIKIFTPIDVNVNNRSDNIMQDLSVVGKNYYVQIYSQTASSLDCNKISDEALNENKTTNITFKELIKKDDCGFLYSVQAEGDSIVCYNFEHYKVLGNKSYKFTCTTAQLEPFSLETVEKIYNSVQ